MRNPDSKRHTSQWTRHTALGMAVVFFYVQVAYGIIEPAVKSRRETKVAKLWQERKAAADRVNKGQEDLEKGGEIETESEKKGTLLAKVPAPELGEGLLSQIPSINLNLLPTAIPKTSVGLSGSAIPKLPNDLKSRLRILPSWFKSLSISYASLRELYLPPNWKPGDFMIIHVQDAHENLEAQRNIARIIESLASSPRTDSNLISPMIVGLEGAHGPFNFSPYRSFPDKEISKEVSDYFLKESFISGPEYVGMTYGLRDREGLASGSVRATGGAQGTETVQGAGVPQSAEGLISSGSQPSSKQFFQPILFWGIEDESLYLKHVKALKESLPLEKKIKEVVQGWESSLTQLKEKNFNQDLQNLDRKMIQYHQDQIKLSEVLKLLTKQGIPADSGMIQKYINALTLEESLNYEKIEKERRALSNALVEKISKEELKDLASASLAYRLGNISYGAFYQYLRDLCAAYKITLKDFPAMDQYIRYVLISDTIRSDELFSEIDALEKKRIESLIQKPKEREIVQLSGDLRLVEKLVSFQLSPEEWKCYEARKEEIKKIEKRIEEFRFGGMRKVELSNEQTLNDKTQESLNSLIPSNFSIFQTLEPFENFNRAAILRDEALVINLLKKVGMGDSNNQNQLAVLVAGGFHTHGMTQILKNKKVAYAVLAPKLGAIEGAGTDYLEIFRRDKTPLEKLFTGERINLKSHLGTAQLEMGNEKIPIFSFLERMYLVLALGSFIKKELQQYPGLNDVVKEKIQEAVMVYFNQEKEKGKFKTIQNLEINIKDEAREFWKELDMDQKKLVLQKVAISFDFQGMNGHNSSSIELEATHKDIPYKTGKEGRVVFKSLQIGDYNFNIYPGKVSFWKQMVTVGFVHAFAKFLNFKNLLNFLKDQLKPLKSWGQGVKFRVVVSLLRVLQWISVFFSPPSPPLDLMEAGLMGKYQILSVPTYTETGQNQGKVSAKVKNLETGEEKEIEIKAQMLPSYGVKGSLNSLKKQTEDSLAKEIIDYALLKLPETFLVLEENSDSIFGISRVKVDGSHKGQTIAIADFLLDDPIGLFHEAAESYFAKNGMENIYKKLMPWGIVSFLDEWEDQGNSPGNGTLETFIHEFESHLKQNPILSQSYLIKGKDEELTFAPQYQEIISYYFYYRDWDLSEKELFPHTFLRGSGRTLREIYAQWEALGKALTHDSLVEFIEYAHEEYSYQIPLRESHLLLLNLKQGFKGKEVLFGLQDRAFGEEKNQELSSKLSEQAKENKPDSETGILEVVNYLGEAGGKVGAEQGAQKGDKYIYDPVVKTAFITKLKSEKSLISKEDDEFRALYEETEKIFKDVLGAARDYLISTGERDRAEGLIDAELFLADLNSANAGAYLYFNFVVINMGLFKELLKQGTLTKDLIAFILAHEIVHLIQFREDLDAGRIQLNAGFKSIDDLIAGKLGQHIDKYGREQDADVRAVELVNNAGYSVSEITLFFEKMAKEKKFRSKFSVMIDKHAPPETRIEYLKKIRKRGNWRKVKAEETEKFSQQTIVELNGERSKNRGMQARLLAMDSLEELEESAKNAENMDELEFLISWGMTSALKKISNGVAKDEIRNIVSSDLIQEIEDAIRKLHEFLERTYTFRSHTILKSKHLWGAPYFDLRRDSSVEEILAYCILSVLATGELPERGSLDWDKASDEELRLYSLVSKLLKEIYFPLLLENKRIRSVSKEKDRVIDVIRKRAESLISYREDPLAFFRMMSLRERPDKDVLGGYSDIREAIEIRERMEGMVKDLGLEDLIRVYKSAVYPHKIGFDLEDENKRFEGFLSEFYSFKNEIFLKYRYLVLDKISSYFPSMSLGELLGILDLILHKEKEFLGKGYWDIEKLVNSIIQELGKQGRKLKDDRRVLLSYFLKNESLHSIEAVGDFVYQELLKDPNSKVIREAIHSSAHLRKQVLRSYISAIQSQNSNKILFFDNLRNGEIKEMIELFLIGRGATVSALFMGMESDFGSIYRALINRFSFSLNELQGLKILKVFIVSHDKVRRNESGYKPLKMGDLSELLWYKVRALHTPDEKEFLKQECARILAEAGFSMDKLPESEQIFQLIYFFDSGGVLSANDFNQKALEMIQDPLIKKKDLEILALFLNSNYLRKKQEEQGIPTLFSIERIDKGQAGIDMSYFYGAPSPEEVILNKAFYQAQTWSEFIVYFNTMVYLKMTGQEKEVERMLKVDKSPGDYSMFQGELVHGEFENLPPEDKPDKPDEPNKPKDVSTEPKEVIHFFGKIGESEFLRKMRIPLIRAFERIFKNLIFGVPKYLDRRDFLREGQEGSELFQYLLNSEKEFLELLKEIKIFLPKSILRDYMLLHLLAKMVHKVDPAFKLEGRIDLKKLKKALGHLQENKEILGVLEEIAPLLSYDKRMEVINSTLLSYWGLKKSGNKKSGLGGRDYKEIKYTDSLPEVDGLKEKFEIKLEDMYKIKLREIFIKPFSFIKPSLLQRIFAAVKGFGEKIVLFLKRLVGTIRQFIIVLFKVIRGFLVDTAQFLSASFKTIGEVEVIWDFLDLYQKYRYLKNYHLELIDGADSDKERYIQAVKEFLGVRYNQELEKLDIDFADRQVENYFREELLRRLYEDRWTMVLVRWLIIFYLRIVHPQTKVELLHFGFQEKETHLDTAIPELIGSHIEKVMLDPLKPFNEKREYIKKMFQRASPVRDKYLEILSENEIVGLSADPKKREELLKNLSSLLAEFSNPYFKDKYSVFSWELERSLKPNLYVPSKEMSSDEHYNCIERNVRVTQKYFESGYLRDDLLLSILEVARTDEEYGLIKGLLYQYKGDVIKDKKTTETVFYEDHLKSFIQDASAKDKKEILLWILGVKKKPLLIIELEEFFGIQLDRLKETLVGESKARFKIENDGIHLNRLGKSAKEEFIRRMFVGENGILETDGEYESFMEAVFEKVMPKEGEVPKRKLKAILQTVLNQSNVERKLKIVQALSINLGAVLEGEEANESEIIAKFFESLGLVGVKMAQVLAHSYDISLTQDLREALNNLSSRADPLSKMVVFETIENVYPGGFKENFEVVGNPLGSASVKIVYTVKRKGASTEHVIKIKRPEVAQMMEEDLKFLKKVLEELKRKGFKIPDGLGDRISGAIAEDVDFQNEQRITKRFEQQINEVNEKSPYKLSDGKTVVEMDIARIHEGTIHQDVTMETDLAGGISLDKEEKLIAAGILNKKELEEVKQAIFDFLMKQMFEYGFYLADPHGGNFHILREGDKIKVILIDSGSAEEVARTPNNQRDLLEAMIWLSVNPGKSIPKEYLYTSVFFTKAGYLSKHLSEEQKLNIIFKYFVDRSLSPETFMEQVKEKFKSQMSAGDKMRFLFKDLGKKIKMSKESKSADILAPIVQPEKFKSWQQRVIYYVGVSIGEEAIYRWIGFVGLPMAFSFLGWDSLIGLTIGIVWSLPGFLFSHTIVRWLKYRDSGKWQGWHEELAKEFSGGFFRSRAFSTILFNLPFFLFPGHPILTLTVSVLIHFVWEIIDAYQMKLLPSFILRMNGRQSKELSPQARARIDKIRRISGIIDPSYEIVRIAETLAKAALRDLGLPEQEYLFVVSDSDDINAGFYPNEKVIEFNWGLLQFLKRNKILDKDTIKFILGHETGHSMISEQESADPNYKHSSLSREYRADEYGLTAIDKGDGKRAYTPMAAFRFMEALKKEEKSVEITTTHPHTHRRLVKIFNDIRHSYWRYLHGEPEGISESLLNVKRSERFYFDQELYGTLTFANLQESAVNATSFHDLLKVMNLFNTLLRFQTVLEEFKNPTETGVKIILEKGHLESLMAHGFSRELEEKFILDSKVNPKEYFTDEQIQEMERWAKEIALEKNITLSPELLKSLPEKLLANQIFLNLHLIEQRQGMHAKRLSPYSSFRPKLSEANDFYKPAILFWEREADIYRSRFSEFEERLEKAAKELAPELSGLSQKDKKQMVTYLYLSGLRYLKRAPHLEDHNILGYLGSLKWENPIKALEIILSHYRQFENDYLLYGVDQPWAESLQQDEQSMMHSGEGPSFEDYMDKMVVHILNEIEKKKDEFSLEELVRIYKSVAMHKRVMPQSIRNLEPLQYDKRILQLLFSKISNFNELFFSLKQLEPYLEDELEALHSHYLSEPLDKAIKNEEELLSLLDFMMGSVKFREQIVSRLELLMKKMTEEFGMEPLKAIGILDAILEKYGLENEWIDPKYDLGSRSNKPYIFSKTYMFLIGKIKDPSTQKNLIDRYYKKYNHRVHMVRYPSGPEFYTDGPLLILLKNIMKEEGLPLKEQLRFFISHGYLPDTELLSSLVNEQEKKEIFDLIMNHEQQFLNNRVHAKEFNDFVSLLAWDWFFSNEDGKLIPALNNLMRYLRPSRYNWIYLERALKTTELKALKDQDFEILFRITSLFVPSSTGLGLPDLKYSSKGSFEDGKYQSERNDYLPIWSRLKEYPKFDFSLEWGDKLLKLWLEEHRLSLEDSSWPLSQKMELVLKCYPHKSLHRNKILVDLIGDPFRMSALDFEIIFSYLEESAIKDILAKRILLEKKTLGQLKLDSYESVKEIMDFYFPVDSEIKKELLNQFLQDVEIELEELKAQSELRVTDQLARDLKKRAAHTILEHLADAIEDWEPRDKRELFEWLIGIGTEKPNELKKLEYSLKADFSDLALILETVSGVERYLFLSTLFIGPKGLLSDETNRLELVRNIFEHGTRERANDQNVLYLVFQETFNASPELKQLDLINGLFIHFLGESVKGDQAILKNLLISQLLTSFGVVGVKLGQILAKQKLITDEHLRETLEKLSDQVNPLDKRYLLNALLFDHSFGSLKRRIKTIGKLLGSASIKQGYLVKKRDGSLKAVKYVRPLARYEVKENLEIAKKVIQALRGKISGLDQISDSLMDEIDHAVHRELNIKQEVSAQKVLGRFSNGEKRNGWELRVTRIDPQLQGEQFFADEFIEGAPLKDHLISQLKRDGQFTSLQHLIYRGILRQVLIKGAYHADLHSGNIFVSLPKKAKKGGKVTLLDFGNNAKFSKKNQETFILLLAALDRLDVKQALNLVQKMIDGKKGVEGLERELEQIILNKGLDEEDKLRALKRLLDEHGIAFIGEFEVLFKERTRAFSG
ncbi:MAG: M48 family metalloprotease [Elusimicrobia bacterium]|nr:M48 family metalloprotease [Elusimicrobiota bacterium]